MFADIKPTFTGEAPTHDPARADYTEVVTNLKWLMAAAAMPGFTVKKGLLMPKLTDGFKLRVRHTMFEVSKYSLDLLQTSDIIFFQLGG